MRQLIDEAHDVALEILTERREKLDALADRLIEKETLDREEVAAFFADVPKRAPRAPEVRGKELAVSRQMLRSPGRESKTPGTLG